MKPEETESKAIIVEPPKGVTKAERLDSLLATLESRRSVIESTLPKIMTPERLFGLARVAITANPTILQCSTLSVIQSLMVAAQLGLNPTGVLGSAYIVPYKNRYTGKKEATLIPGYRGLMELAIRSGMVKMMESRLVREGEVFTIEWGSSPKITHFPHTTIPEGCQVVGCYAVAWFDKDFKQSDYMDRGELDLIRNRSKAKTSGPWVTDTNEMYRKTVVRRLCKYLPLSSEMATALSMEEALDQGVTAAPIMSLPPTLAPEPQEIPEGNGDGVDDQPPEEEDFTPPTPEEEQAAMEAADGKTKGQKLADKIKKRNGQQADLDMK
jgi:recombination protein RecT